MQSKDYSRCLYNILDNQKTKVFLKKKVFSKRPLLLVMIKKYLRGEYREKGVAAGKGDCRRRDGEKADTG